ncbi:MAG: PASTA domain-containing protein [Oscillospiraceae bacterium]
MLERICDNCLSRAPADSAKCPHCGIRFENTNPGGALPNGWVLAQRYTVGRYIDIDGEGVSYSAIDGDTLQRVIIKEYMPVTLCSTRDGYGALVSKPGCEVLFKTLRMDFVELFDQLMRMGLTEGLVQVLDVFEENNTAYAVMEKIEGPTLTEYLTKQEAPMDSSRTLATLRPILLGVEAIHAAGLVHRGICPDNIILESGGTARLGGFATLALRQQGSELKSKLYPGYSAPEQYSASEFEGRYTDVYALGAVLFRMLTGEDPVPANERRIEDTQATARNINKEIPNFLSTSILRATRLAPNERLQSIGDLRIALSGEGARVPVSKQPKEGAAEEERGLFGLTKQQLLVGGIALGAVVLILVIVLLISIFSGGNRNPASSSSLSTTSMSETDKILIPDFTNQVADDIVANSKYTDVFKFEQFELEYDDEVEEGKVITQTPAPNAEWDGETKITLVVSQGKEPVELTDLTGLLKAEAEIEMQKMGYSQEYYSFAAQTNDGNYAEGEVIKTDPPAKTKVQPNKDKIVIYIASGVSTVSMPDVTNRSASDAISVLRERGFNESNIKTETVANNGKYAAGVVISTSPRPGESVAPSSQPVTIQVTDRYIMTDSIRSEFNSFVSSGNISGLKQYLDERKLYFTYNATPVEVPNDGSHTAGALAAIDGLPANNNAEIVPGTQLTIKVYAAPE